MFTSTMLIGDLLKLSSLKSARVIIAPKEMDVQITGINILEAPDIEKWGKQGLVILTSYFALQNLDQPTLASFFDKLKTIGICCLIVKINRLVKEIPANFIALCKSHNIPLIEIGEADRYEDIIVEVLGFILARREQRLSLYYRLSKISSRMSIEMLGIPEILRKFKQFLQFDLTLENLTRGFSTSTNPRLIRYELLEELPLEQWEYMTFEYKRFRCKYLSAGTGKEGTLVRIDISSFESKRHFLLIHEKRNHVIDVNDVIVIENLIRSLQFELLREFSGKQRQLLNKNSLIADVLRGAYIAREEFLSVVEQLEINPEEKVRVLTLDYYFDGKFDSLSMYDLRSNLRAEMQRLRPRLLYYIAPSYDQFILPAEPVDRCLNPSDIMDVLNMLIEQTPETSNLRFYGGLSGFFSVNDIAQADAQSKAVASFLTRNYPRNTIQAFDNLGIFKLFVNDPSHDLNNFIRPEIKQLYEEHPELFKTLSVYLRTNRSFIRTAEELFLHPKTVKYRIQKITGSLNLNLENIHDVTILLTSIEIIRFRDGQILHTLVETPCQAASPLAGANRNGI